MCGVKNYFQSRERIGQIGKSTFSRHNTIPTLVIIISGGGGAQRAFEGQQQRTPHAKNTREHKKAKKIDVVVLRARTNEPNDDLGAARTGIRDGEPGDGIPRGLVQQTRPLVLREMHR